MNFNEESNSISVSLRNLEDYCQTMGRSPEQLQVEYNLISKSFIVSSRLTGSYNDTDVRQKFRILNQATPITNLLNAIQIIYENTPLVRIHIEADIDDIGLVVSSLKVNTNFFCSSSDLILSTDSTVGAISFNFFTISINLSL